MKLEKVTDLHLSQMPEWFPNELSCSIWAGPEFRYPFTAATFREDMRLQLPSYSLIGNDDELLGFGQYYLREARCHLARLVIAPRRRGRAIGASLIRDLVHLGCRELEVSECSLFVLESNSSALRLYTRLGFSTVPYPGEAPALEGCLYMIAASERIQGSWES